MLFKHFNQWIESPLLPLTLAGEDFSAQALAQYIMSELGDPLTSQAQLVSSYYSEIQNAEIPLIPMIDFFTTNLDKEQFLKSNFISLHRNGISKMAMGESIWSSESKSNDIKYFRKYCQYTYLPHPSNNQIVEAGVKDVSLCRNSGRGERLSSMLSFYRSTVTETVEEKASIASTVSPPKARGSKRRNSEQVTKASEKIKLEQIMDHVIN